jgi:hypothetical protein
MGMEWDQLSEVNERREAGRCRLAAGAGRLSWQSVAFPPISDRLVALYGGASRLCLRTRCASFSRADRFTSSRCEVRSGWTPSHLVIIAATCGSDMVNMRADSPGSAGAAAMSPAEEDYDNFVQLTNVRKSSGEEDEDYQNFVDDSSGDLQQMEDGR